MKKINIGIIGFGTVGSGVVKILAERRDSIKRRAGVDINVVKICDKDLASKRSTKVNSKPLTKNPDDILEDKGIDIVVELIGGINPARGIITRAIKNGKYVVTANKALLAVHGRELFSMAKRHGVDIYFEASVGGAIPIIKALRESFISSKINTIYGIINGTSNFALTKMGKENCSLKEALEDARRRGFAERDPSLDISGMDSAHKLAILTLLSFGKYVDLKDIYTEGIEDIEPHDLQYAGELGYAVKLLAIAKKMKQSLEVRVHPTLLKKEHLLSSISGVYNAVYIKGDLIGNALLYGEGAGQMPAASAVISDIADVAKIIACSGNNFPVSGFSGDVKNIKKMQDITSRYYIHFSAIDQPGVLACISGILGRFGISISSVNQKERRKEKIVPIVMMTHDARERNMQKALAMIDKLPAIRKKSIAIRVED